MLAIGEDGEVALLFLFDMDDVLYDYDWRVRMAGLTRLTGLSVEELRRRWWHDEGETAAEAGRFPDAASYLAAFRAALGVEITPEQWIANRRSAMTPRPEAIAAVELASRHGRVSLLTNNGPLLGAHLPALAPEIAPLFGDHLRTSSWYGARKPDPVVFDRAIASYGADPADVFFADDLPQNVAAAASRGITAHLYESPAGLQAAVRSFAER